MPIQAIREDIKIDTNHIDLIYGLIVSAKPRSLPEFGLGRAVSTDRILDAIRYNAIPRTSYTVIDNWRDFGGVMPAEAALGYSARLNLVTADEGDYIRESIRHQRHFDFYPRRRRPLQLRKVFRRRLPPPPQPGRYPPLPRCGWGRIPQPPFEEK